MSDAGPRLTVPQLLAALAVIVLVTAVVPPAIAWTLNAGRAEKTLAELTNLRESLGSWLLIAGRPPVACGRGRLPDLRPAASRTRPEALAIHQAWLAAAVADPALQRLSVADGWGRCLIVQTQPAETGGHRWLLSAGANGLLETAPTDVGVGGDDLGVHVR